MATLISQMAGFLADPIYHWAALTIAILVLAAFNRNGTARTALVLAVYYCGVVFSPLPSLMLRHLESRYSPVMSPAPKPAVVVLSGGTLEYNISNRQYYWYVGADRIMQPLLNLMSSGSLLVISGREGGDDSSSDFMSETESMGRLAQQMGVAQDRLYLETSARTTRENAIKVRKVLQGKGITDFYLVTSAFHMPRAMRSFVDAGMKPTPYPVDYRVLGYRDAGFAFVGIKNIKFFHLALHEYLGSLYYALLKLF